MSLTRSRNNVGSASKDDPLQPLRTMADRVGKEVEKFAERVDHWHTHGNEDGKAKYQTTLRMVDKFKDLADATVKELKNQSEAENKGELNQSVRRRIQTMATTAARGTDGDDSRVFRSVLPSVESSSLHANSSSVQELRQWQAELATWELLRIIIEQQYREPGSDPEAEKQARIRELKKAHRYSPNSEIWDRFLLEDDQAKEKQLILRWLEQTAKDGETDISSITAQLEAESGKGTNTWTSGWLDTKSKIKQAKRTQISDQRLPKDIGLKTSEGDPLVTRLDPDAPNRDAQSLEKSDEYYERALWMVCYEMLRRGVPWSEICEWCKDRNEAWRGVSIGAAYESHANGGPNVAGPTVGYLFRRMCLYASRGASSPYEAAVYGLLCGDLKEVEPVCRSWDDHLYAHCNALLLSRFDEYLVKNYPSRVRPEMVKQFAFRDATGYIGSWESSTSRVIQLLRQQKVTTAQSMSPMKLIQSHIISNTVDELVFQVGVALAIMLQQDERPTSLVIDPESTREKPSSRSPNEQREINADKQYFTLAKDPHAFRILVHVFITLRKGIGLYDMEDFTQWTALDNTIAAYIEFLRITKRISLIPLYAAQLEDDRAVHCLARVLPDIKNSEERGRLLSLMQQYRLDPAEVIAQNFLITVTRVCIEKEEDRISRYEMLNPIDHYLWPGQCIKANLPGMDVKPEDDSLIEALSWYLYLENDINDTFNNLTVGLEFLLINGRVGAAIKLCSDMDLETISHIKTQAYCGYPFNFTEPGAEEQDPDVQRSARRTASTSGQLPNPSEVPGREEHHDMVLLLRNVSKSYYALHQLIRAIVLLREWRSEENNLIEMREHGNKVNTKRAKEIFSHIQVTMDSILLDNLFEHAGSDPKMEFIQRAYLPELLISYISVIQAAAYFTNRDLAVKAMDVATMVADSDQKWLQDVLLETGRMSEVVETLALVSRAMLTLGEHDDKKKPSTKKRGNRGETLRIWDLNVRN